MNGYIIFDLETRNFLHCGGAIYQVGLIATDEFFNIIEEKELSIIENENEIYYGYGYGYKDISHNNLMKNEFNNFLNKYHGFKLMAHNCGFDKSFLVHFNWIKKDIEILNSINILKQMNVVFKSYAMSNLINGYDVNINMQHTSLDDCRALVEILQKASNGYLVEEEKRNAPRQRKARLERTLTNKAIKREVAITDLLFENQLICFSGKGEYERKDLIEMAKQHGAECTDSITNKVTLLVVGDITHKTTKIKKAEEKNIQIIDMVDFMEMIN